MKRRTFLKIGAGCAVGMPSIITSQVSYAAKIPRTHGPVTKKIINFNNSHKAGTILISNQERILDLILSSTQVARYSVAIGRDGFTWTGAVSYTHLTLPTIYSV